MGKGPFFSINREEKAALIHSGLGIENMNRITDQLTHADHIGGHSEFKTIYVHEGDADRLKNGTKGIAYRANKKRYRPRHYNTTSEALDPDTYTPYQG
ncbi:beta-lactamase [Bacillus freudenreichii]|nr:beta-lactamase [Bacillus freudenreichii]